MWSQFLLENIHFAVNLLAALILFAIFWLYFDAWLAKRSFKDSLKILGLFLLAVSYLVDATVLESTILPTSWLGSQLPSMLVLGLRISGYLLVIFGLATEPLQKRPHTEGLSFKIVPLAINGGSYPFFLLPVLPAVVSFLYLRRATLGLENHLKKVALGFFGLSISELISLSALFRQTHSVDLYNLVAPFGPLWIMQLIVLLISILILRSWVFGYLLKRFQSQLFMIFTFFIMVIFIVVTVCFSGLLLNNLQQESLAQLQTDAKVLQFTVEGERQIVLSDASLLSQNNQLIQAVQTKSAFDLAAISQNFLVAKKDSSVVVIDDSGKVLARGEDTDQIGDSISDQPLVKRALAGQSASTVEVKNGQLSPVVTVKAISPIQKDNQVIGAVVTAVNLDDAFLIGIKKATGLESSILGGNQISATTLAGSNSQDHLNGLEESDPAILEKVLKKGDDFYGSVNILNLPYLAAYLPLKDVDNTPVGMIFIGRPEQSVLTTAALSIELTFVIAVILLVLSILPSYLIARSLERQIS